MPLPSATNDPRVEDHESERRPRRRWFRCERGRWFSRAHGGGRARGPRARGAWSRGARPRVPRGDRLQRRRDVPLLPPTARGAVNLYDWGFLTALIVTIGYLLLTPRRPLVRGSSRDRTWTVGARTAGARSRSGGATRRTTQGTSCTRSRRAGRSTG